MYCIFIRPLSKNKKKDDSLFTQLQIGNAMGNYFEMFKLHWPLS